MPNFEDVDYGDAFYDHGNGCTCERGCVCGKRPQAPPDNRPGKTLRQTEEEIIQRYPWARTSINQARRWTEEEE